MTITYEEYDKRLYKTFLSGYLDEKSIDTLQGILTGIVIDSIVNSEEAEKLQQWLDTNQRLKNTKPYDFLISKLEAILSDGIVDDEEIKDIKYLTDRLFRSNETDLLVTQSIRELHGVFQGILFDQELSDSEIKNLYQWITDNDHLKGSYPYDEIETLLTHSLHDKVITTEERQIVSAFISQFITKEREATETSDTWQKLKSKYLISAICCTDPEIIFNSKVFCFTGESKLKKRADIVAVIESFGGEYRDTISQKTDYLIVGAKGNDCWAFTGYGRKIEKALELRKQGQLLKIIHENDFWDAIS